MTPAKTFAVGSEPKYIEVTVKQEPVEAEYTQDNEEDTKGDELCKAKHVKREHGHIESKECNDKPCDPWNNSLAAGSKHRFIEVTIKQEPMLSQSTEDGEIEKNMSVNHLKYEKEEATDESESGSEENSESGVSIGGRDKKSGDLDGTVGNERWRGKQDVEIDNYLNILFTSPPQNIKRKKIMNVEGNIGSNECNGAAPIKKSKRTHTETQDKTGEQKEIADGERETDTDPLQVARDTSSSDTTTNRGRRVAGGDDSPDTRRYKCSICQRRFKISSHLNTHLRTHTGEKPFECTTCHVRFNQSGQLNRHLKIHTGEKPYECEVCNQRFSCSGNLKTHIRIHTGEKPFECETCHRRFNESGQLSRHVRIHTGEKPFECEICQRRFNVGSHLKAHLRIHTGEKPFQCVTCQRRFIRSSDLKKHLRVHTGEKPYECAKCSRKFANSSHLTKHLKTHILDS